eukprot:m.283454 g.283454  ORF g.283454 m.283454 type:complete len:154 (-) comp27000_c2_seq25:71-532(-)
MMYRNGAPYGTAHSTVVRSYDPASASTAIIFGKRFGVATGPAVDSFVDAVGIFGSALTAFQVQKIYESGRTPSIAPIDRERRQVSGLMAVVWPQSNVAVGTMVVGAMAIVGALALTAFRRTDPSVIDVVDGLPDQRRCNFKSYLVLLRSTSGK